MKRKNQREGERVEEVNSKRGEMEQVRKEWERGKERDEVDRNLSSATTLIEIQSKSYMMKGEKQGKNED